MEDIEILEIDDIIVKKSDNKKEDNVINDKLDNKKNKHKKKKLKKGEKLFLIINIILLLGIIGFYGYRTIYYYKETHNVVENITIKDKLTNLSNIAYKDDGLYEKDGYFYYKGINVNNYVYYSGRMFRIIDINNGIHMIEEDIPLKLVWGVDTKYSDSLVHTFVNDYLNTLKDYEIYLQENNWCNESVDVENYSCSEMINEYVGLLSTKDYLQAGGKNSYLNINDYFWTINQDKDGNAYYVNNSGGINNINKSNDTYFSYGVRVVVTLKEDISILSGDGSKNNPFIIENLGQAMLRDNSVGSFVKYHNMMFRIANIDDNGVMLIYSDKLENEENYNGVNNYLNQFLKKLDTNDLVKFDYVTNEYSYSNKYNYKSVINKGNGYVSIPKVGDLFLNDSSNYWLNTVNDKTLGLMYAVSESKMYFGDLKSNKHYVRPIIKLNSEIVVSDGIGTENNPYVIGDSYVKED